jgi:hypothetical protein
VVVESNRSGAAAPRVLVVDDEPKPFDPLRLAHRLRAVVA